MKQRAGCHWTPDEDRRLAAVWSERALVGIARVMGRTMRAVSVRAFKLRLGSINASTTTMKAFTASTGYSRSRVQNAATRLGIVFERAKRQDPRQRGKTIEWAITDEQSDRILEFLSTLQDGRRLYSNRALRSERGVWGVGIKPVACVGCGTTTKPHRAKGRCARCYHRRYVPIKPGFSSAV